MSSERPQHQAPSRESEQIRLLTADDIPAALALSTAAGWNQTEDDWRMLLALAPEGCFAMDVDGQVVTTATLVCYGRRLGWIGMVLTRFEYRGRGFARRLLTLVLERADSAGVETVKLDATDQGRPLYEKLGFQAEQPVERWNRGPVDPHSTALKTGPAGDAIRSLDYEACGVDRRQLLQILAGRRTPIECPGGFVFARSGRTGQYLGPCVATDQTVAGGLIDRCLRAGSESSWCWDLLPANREALALAQSFSFVRQRQLLRMARGKLCRSKEELVYALAGFELG